MRGRRIGTVVVLAALMGMFVLGTLQADAHPSDIDVRQVFTDGQGRIVAIGGTIVCPPDERFILRVNIALGTDRLAVGQAHGDCQEEGLQDFASHVQWLTTRVDNAAGVGCEPGIVARGRARTNDGGTKTFADNDFICGSQS